VQVEALIKELLATGSMNEDTTADLNRWAAEAAAGTLHPDDAAYIEALYAKVTGAPLPETTESAPAEPARVDGLTLEDWRDRALRAEAELAALKDSVSTTSA
jgi:HEAT repeat protein